MSSGFQQLERAMQKIKQRRYRAETWQKILGRFEESGLTAPAFCARERISSRVFIVGGCGSAENRVTRCREGGTAERKTASSSIWAIFGRRDSRFEVRLELGAGVILSIGEADVFRRGKIRVHL